MSLIQEATNELARLYRLKGEGKKINVLIEKLEELIRLYCELCESEQLAAEETDAKDN